VHFFSIQKKAPSRAQHCMKWFTTRTPHNSKLTTPQQMALLITQSTKALQSNGYEILLGQRQEQGQFNVGWAPGDTNMGDYFTKHHSPAHLKLIRPYYLHDKHSPMIRHDTRLAIMRGCVDISPISHPDRALSALSYGLRPNCNLSQSHHGHMPIACAHTTDNSNTHLSRVSYRNLLRNQYRQGFSQCEKSYTQLYQHLNAHQLHLNAPYKHLSLIVSTVPVGRNN
jgi:hypothetical protein